MAMSEEKLTKLINKMINVIKPQGVLNVYFKLEPLGIRKDEYYMYITYVVPDGSEFLKSPNMRISHDVRIGWNHEIKKNIKNYFDADVSITSSSISSESYYNRQREY